MAINEVALRLLLKGQREMAAGLSDTAKQTAGLSDAMGKASKTAKGFSSSLTTTEKASKDVAVATSRSSAAIVKSNRAVADSMQTVAAAAEKAASLRVRWSQAVTEAQEKQTAGDLEGAKAAAANAKALEKEALAAEKVARAMRSNVSASKAQLASLKASRVAMGSPGGVSGGRYAFGALAGVGRGLTKTGLAAGAYLGYEGIKNYGQLATSQTRLTTLAGVPQRQIPGLTRFETRNSVGLRQDANTLSQMAYFIASSAPGKPYSLRQLEAKIRGAAVFATITGTDPAAAARVFGTIGANGGLGTRNPTQIAGVARATIGLGDMTADDYIQALGSGGLAVAARQHKISLTQLGGVLANLGDIGIRGSLAGNRLTHAINLLSSPSPKAASVLGGLGLSPTVIDQVMRSQGLGAGLQLLRTQLVRNEPFLANQMVTSRAQLAQYGFNPAQARQIQRQGGASAVDLMLSRAFGGARQMTTVLALLQGMSRTNTKTQAIQAQSSPASVQSAFRKASNTPEAQWKRLTLDVQQLELAIGKRLIPDLVHLFDWFGKNEGVIKDVAIGLSTIAIPAIGAYAASLVGKAINSTSRFVSGLRGVSPAASEASNAMSGTLARGAGIAQSAVLGLTTAVGIWGLGAATRGHGTGGAVTAGLGGAIAGMTAGLAIGGPWGAAIGAAGGALIGLASHFDNTTSAIQNQINYIGIWEKDLKGTLGTNSNMFRTNSKSFLQNWLTKHGSVSPVLNKYGVTGNDVLNFLMGAKIGTPYSMWSPQRFADKFGASWLPFMRATQGNMGFNQANDVFGLLNELLQAFSGALGNQRQVSTLFHHRRHKVGHHAAGGYAAPFVPTWVGEGGKPEIITPLVPSYVTPHHDLAAMGAGGGLELHSHIYLDGREIAESTAKHMLDVAARR